MVSDRAILTISLVFLLLSVSYTLSLDSISGYVINEAERSCTETDELLDLFTQGTTSGNLGTLTYDKTDRCLDSQKLMEYYCEDNSYRRLGYKCPNGCSSGTCL